MTIRTLHKSFIHLVMEGLFEGSFDVGVAAITELWLDNLEHARFSYGSVYAVAAGATDPGLTMGRPLKVGMGRGMAAQTGRVNLFCGGLGELKDLRYVAATIDVLLAWAMAGLASDSIASVCEGKLPVRIGAELGGDLLMAGCASFRADEIGGRRL